MKKKDLILIGVLLVIAAAGLIFVNLSRNKTGETVNIIVEGKIVNTLSLSEDREYTVENEYGTNRIVVKNGYVYMEYADCPDQYCVKHKKMGRSGDPIICLPHKLVVEVAED